MNQPVNVYGTTEVWDKYGLLDEVYDGFGYKDSDGNITWYEDYSPPKDDEFHSTLIISYGGGKDISELQWNAVFIRIGENIMTKEQKELKKSWLQIMAILKETGYDYLYMEDISRVANVIRKELGLDE